MVAPFFIGGWNDCSPELFQLLVVCCLHQSEICNKEFLKSYKWISQKAKKPELISKWGYMKNIYIKKGIIIFVH